MCGGGRLSSHHDVRLLDGWKKVSNIFPLPGSSSRGSSFGFPYL